MQLPYDIDLETTLFSGQTFLWKHHEDGYLGCVNGTAAHIDSTRNLTWDGPVDETYWRNYFDIDRDYASIAERYAHDSYVAAAFARYGGMRVLRQPAWETLCSFVISANNNIGRITSIMTKLSERYGDAICFRGHTLHAFPSPKQMLQAGEEGIRACGPGYRAPYLLECARRMSAGFDMEAIAVAGYENALKQLMTLPGVGEKVADCILLFACGYASAFPVDVWVRRVMRTLYGAEDKNAAIKAEGLRLFGTDAGLVQQVLFHAARMGLFPALCKKEPTVCACGE